MKMGFVFSSVPPSKCMTGSFSRTLKFPISCLPYLMDHPFDRRIRKTPQKALKPTKNYYYYSGLLITAEGRDTYYRGEGGDLSLRHASTNCWAHGDSYVIDKRRSLPRSYNCCSVMLTIHLHLMLKVKNDWRHTSKTRAILCLDIIIISSTNYIISTTITVITVK